MLHVDVAHGHEAMPEHVHRRLGLLEDDVAEQRLEVILLVQTVQENHLVGDGSEPFDLDLHGPTGLTTDDLLVGQLQLHGFRPSERPQTRFQDAGRMSAPAPVSTSMPHWIDLLSSNRLLTVVCATTLPMLINPWEPGSVLGPHTVQEIVHVDALQRGLQQGVAWNRCDPFGFALQLPRDRDASRSEQPFECEQPFPKLAFS